VHAGKKITDQRDVSRCNRGRVVSFSYGRKRKRGGTTFGEKGGNGTLSIILVFWTTCWRLESLLLSQSIAMSEVQPTAYVL
jgi:hypothetical protein